MPKVYIENCRLRQYTTDCDGNLLSQIADLPLSLPELQILKRNENQILLVLGQSSPTITFNTTEIIEVSGGETVQNFANIDALYDYLVAQRTACTP